ncbi:MAG: hypothetical protein K9N52_10810 [Verrucomicrobia bacterium]|nr:hypothetical protein [Verrucomicrobiota bacterium]
MSVLKALIIAASLVIISSGCLHTRKIDTVDITAPGWNVLRGAAVWSASSGSGETAGELFAAVHENGDFIIMFGKTPLPIVSALRTGEVWRIEFGSNEEVLRGRGTPPERIAWFRLGAALCGRRLPEQWSFTRLGGGKWRLRNEDTGETVEGYLSS